VYVLPEIANDRRENEQSARAIAVHVNDGIEIKNTGSTTGTLPDDEAVFVQ
jgi:hypothetical protein